MPGKSLARSGEQLLYPPTPDPYRPTSFDEISRLSPVPPNSVTYVENRC